MPVWMSAPRTIVQGAPKPSICRIPDDRENVIINSDRAPQIGVDSARAELGSSERKAYILASRSLGSARPAGTNFDVAREDAIVGLGVSGLAIVGFNQDLGLDAERFQLAFEAAVSKLRHDSDCRHFFVPFLRRREGIF